MQNFVNFGCSAKNNFYDLSCSSMKHVLVFRSQFCETLCVM